MIKLKLNHWNIHENSIRASVFVSMVTWSNRMHIYFCVIKLDRMFTNFPFSWKYIQKQTNDNIVSKDHIKCISWQMKFHFGKCYSFNSNENPIWLASRICCKAFMLYVLACYFVEKSEKCIWAKKRERLMYSLWM